MSFYPFKTAIDESLAACRSARPSSD